MQDSRINPEDIGENFPVASRFLPEEWRLPILDFYSFLRGMDDIADSSILQREEKRDLLRNIRLGLQEKQSDMLPNWALPYYRQVQDGNLSEGHGDKLWQAFWQDTEKKQYHNFAEVIAYCNMSAAPVGRAVLEISKEQDPDLAAADALCNALQLINHLQDVRSDYVELGRIYLPQDWLLEQGLSEKVLEKAETGPKLRHIFDLWLDEVDKLLFVASRLPETINNRGFRWELSIIIAFARGLARKLRKSDPMTSEVKLSKLDKILLSIGAIVGVC